MGPRLRLEAEDGMISERTGVSLGVIWAVLAVAAVGAGVGIRVSLVLDRIEGRLALQGGEIRLIARRQGIEFPEAEQLTPIGVVP